MKRLTRIEFELVHLYGQGLKFDEISLYLNINSKGVYNNAKRKDNQRVMRAREKRIRNISFYRCELNEYIKKVKEHNKSYIGSSDFVQKYNILPIATAKENHRKQYIVKSMQLSFRKYNKYKMRLLSKMILV